MLFKTIFDLWPGDIIPERYRWNVDQLEPWTDKTGLGAHICAQISNDNALFKCRKARDDLTCLRFHVVWKIFDYVTRHGHLNFKLNVENSTCTCSSCCNGPHWYIRVHPPVRISPEGTPILLMSALDRQGLGEQLQTFQDKDELHDSRLEALNCSERIFGSLTGFTTIFLCSGVVHLFRYMLLLNSNKIRPSAWQKENLPLGNGSPWMATFLRPLYADGVADQKKFLPDLVDSNCCAKCKKSANNLQVCGRCKVASYCSKECQRHDWTKHKWSCTNA